MTDIQKVKNSLIKAIDSKDGFLISWHGQELCHLQYLEEASKERYKKITDRLSNIKESINRKYENYDLQVEIFGSIIYK